MTRKHKKSQMIEFNRGFTLIELMVAVALVGVLVTVGIPSFSELLANSRMTAFSNDLVTEIYVTRSEAVKRGAAVTICATTDQATCSGSNNWGTGWIIFTDSGTAGSVDGTDQILFIHQSAQSNITLNVSRPYTRFLPSGFAT